MVASSSQPSGSGHAPIESERTSAATFPGVQENHRLAGNRPSSNNQSVSFFFPMLFSPTTYLTTRHDSPSTSFSFLLLLSLTLRPSFQTFLPQTFPPPRERFPFSFHRCCMDLLDLEKRRNSRWNSCHVDFSLGKGGWQTVGERWSRRFGLINFLNDGTWYCATTSFLVGLCRW